MSKVTENEESSHVKHVWHLQQNIFFLYTSRSPYGPKEPTEVCLAPDMWFLSPVDSGD